MVLLIPGWIHLGSFDDPTYQDACSDITGHAEAVQVDYDPYQVSFEELLDIFWENHNLTSTHRQGLDVGTQYYSTVFVYNGEQEKIAIESKQNLERSRKFKKPIVTEIKHIQSFYKAEDYHQKYYEKNGLF